MNIRKEDVTGTDITDSAVLFMKSGFVVEIDDWWLVADDDGELIENEFEEFRIAAETSDGRMLVFDNIDVESILLSEADTDALIGDRDEYNGPADADDTSDAPQGETGDSTVKGYEVFPGCTAFGMTPDGQRVPVPDDVKTVLSDIFGGLNGRRPNYPDIFTRAIFRDGPAQDRSFLDEILRGPKGGNGDSGVSH